MVEKGKKCSCYLEKEGCLYIPEPKRESKESKKEKFTPSIVSLIHLLLFLGAFSANLSWNSLAFSLRAFQHRYDASQDNFLSETGREISTFLFGGVGGVGGVDGVDGVGLMNIDYNVGLVGVGGVGLSFRETGGLVSPNGMGDGVGNGVGDGVGEQSPGDHFIFMSFWSFCLLLYNLPGFFFFPSLFLFLSSLFQKIHS